MEKKTVVIGASPNPARYAYSACHLLDSMGYHFVPVGIKKGTILGQQILDIREKPPIEGVDTITLYVGPAHQEEWYEYFMSLRPNRIIFNPGTENSELKRLSEKHGIETDYACTLVLLNTGQY